MSRPNVAIIGGGRFGRTLEKVLHEADHADVAVCAREGGVYPRRSIETLNKADVVVYAVSSTALRQASLNTSDHIRPDSIVLSAVKGLDYREGALRTMTDVLAERLLTRTIGAISGPNLEAEINKGLPTYTAIALPLPEETKARHARLGIAHELCNLFTTGSFRAIVEPDLLGLEYGGALKNILAIAAGIVEGYFGDARNTQGSILMFGLHDLHSVYAHVSHKRTRTPRKLPEVFLGDAFATATSAGSRNYLFGKLLGSQLQHGPASADEILCHMDGETVEGLPTLEAVHKYALAHTLDLLIVPQLHGLVSGNKSMREAIAAITNAEVAFEKQRYKDFLREGKPLRDKQHP
ncbi:hypothetical protein HY493_02860 [Candidatus Woesearchaeota archaeon]|nr:hypothetical protein [Candidatus Woesearchaeota archaeon]